MTAAAPSRPQPSSFDRVKSTITSTEGSWAGKSTGPRQSRASRELSHSRSCWARRWASAARSSAQLRGASGCGASGTAACCDNRGLLRSWRVRVVAAAAGSSCDTPGKARKARRTRRARTPTTAMVLARISEVRPVAALLNGHVLDDQGAHRCAQMPTSGDARDFDQIDEEPVDIDALAGEVHRIQAGTRPSTRQLRSQRSFRITRLSMRHGRGFLRPTLTSTAISRSWGSVPS